MAFGQIHLIIGEHPTYEDGDISGAFNSRRILHVHAEEICCPRLSNGKKIGGFVGDRQVLAELFLSNIYEFKFERVSDNEVKKIRLSDISEILIISNTEFIDFTGRAAQMDVKQYIERRIIGNKKLLFGTDGREIWYGGRTNASISQLDRVWTDIETRTPKRKVNHINFPNLDRKKYLVVDVDDFDDNESNNLTSSLLDVSDPDNIITVKKRKNFSDWRSHYSLKESDVLDVTKKIDMSGTEFVRNTVIEIKTI